MAMYDRSASATKNREITPRPARWQVLLAILAISLGSSALAQTAPPGTYAPAQPYFYPAPPAGFNPLAASDADLRTYGFPPRPAVTAAGYANWAKTVTGGKTRLNLTAVQSTVAHRPAMVQAEGAMGPVGSQCAEGSPCGVNGSNCQEGSNCGQNWAGYAVTSASSPGLFMTNNSSVFIEFVVPPVATENCLYTYTPCQAAVWAGLDGWQGTQGAGDILQAGVLATACPEGPYYPGYGTEFQSGATYQVAYQWYTDDCNCSYMFLRVTTGPQAGQWFTMNAGDTAQVTVWYSTTGTPGNLYIVDWTTGSTASLGFSEPPGTGYPYYGTSAEWILERPSYGSIATVDLQAYGSSTMPDNGSLSVIGAYNGYAPGSDAPGSGSLPLWAQGMYCDAAITIPPYNSPDWYPSGDRAKGQSITWTGGTPGSYVNIFGYTPFTGPSGLGPPVTSYAYFTCNAPLSAGQFTVPAAVLGNLPPSSNGYTSASGHLDVLSGNVQRFAAPGLDLGLLFFGAGSGISVPFN